MIQVTFPIGQQYIKMECERVREAIKATQAELKILSTMLHAIQDQCIHPDTWTSGDYGGGTDTNCRVCGKSW